MGGARVEQEFRDGQARDRNRQQREMREVLIESWPPPHLVVSEDSLWGCFCRETHFYHDLCNPQHLLFLRFFFFFFKVLFQTLFEVNAQNVQKSRETVFWLLIFPPFPFAPVFSPLGGGGTVGCCLLPKEGDGFSIVNVSNWTFGPCFFLQLIQSPVKILIPSKVSQP